MFAISPSLLISRTYLFVYLTRYGLDGPGIKFQWGREIPHPSRPALGRTQPSVQRVAGLFPGGKAAGAWR